MVLISKIIEQTLRIIAIIRLLLAAVTVSGICAGDVHILRGVIQIILGVILAAMFHITAEEVYFRGDRKR